MDQFNLGFWFKHQEQLLRLLDCIADVEESQLTQEIIGQLQELAIKGIGHSYFFTREGAIHTKQRHKITIVIAIVNDAEFALEDEKGKSRTNHIVRLHQARQTIREKLLGFAWTIIPKTSDVPAETLKEYPYTADDMDKLLLLNVEKGKASNHLTKLMGWDQDLAPITLNIGPPKKPINVRVIRGKNKTYVAQAYNTNRGKTPKSYISETFKTLLEKDDIRLPFSFIVPYQSKSKLWVGIVFKFEKSNISIEFLMPKNDQKIQEEVTILIKGRQKLNVLKGVVKELNKRFKETLGIVPASPEPKVYSAHMRGYSSGPIIHREIAQLISGGLPSTSKELTDEEAYQLKRADHEQFRGKGQNFSLEFEEDPTDRTQPLRVKKQLPIQTAQKPSIPNKSKTKLLINRDESVLPQQVQLPKPQALIECDDNADIPESIKHESIKLAEDQKKVGPRKIEGWELKDGEDKGNCFYLAIVHQLGLINHDFLKSIKESPDAAHDALRKHIQCADYKDCEWADEKQINTFVEKFSDIILAVVDTNTHEKGFECRSFDDKDVTTYARDDDGIILPKNKKIIRIAYTGNHFISVISHPALALGQIKDAFAFESQIRSE